MSGKRWTPAEFDFALRSRNPREIMEYTGRTYSAVTQYMFKMGIQAKTPRGVPRLTLADREAIVKRYTTTPCSLQSIANDYGVCRDTIRQVIIKYFKRGFVK